MYACACLEQCLCSLLRCTSSKCSIFLHLCSLVVASNIVFVTALHDCVVKPFYMYHIIIVLKLDGGIPKLATYCHICLECRNFFLDIQNNIFSLWSKRSSLIIDLWLGFLWYNKQVKLLELYKISQVGCLKWAWRSDVFNWGSFQRLIAIYMLWWIHVCY